MPPSHHAPTAVSAPPVAEQALKLVRPQILFVTLSLDIGGAERQLALVLPELVRRGWPVSLFCFNRPGAYADGVARSGVEVIGPPREAQGRATSHAVRAILSAAAAVRLIGIIRRKRPKIVHFFLTEPYLFGAPVSVMCRVPIRIMSRREITAQHHALRKVRPLESKLHRSMAAVLGNSRSVIADLLAEGCTRERLGLIYNGVDLDGFGRTSDREAIRRSLGIAPDALVAVNVANLIAYKGHLDLLGAVARIGQRGGPPITLLLIGRDEGHRALLEQKAEALGLRGRVIFAGERVGVEPLLEACDIGVHASHTEGFSNAVIESMTAGLPMVVTDVGGNAEAVLDGEQGLVVPAQRPDLLADALERLARNPDLSRRFAQAARARAQSMFSLSACVDRYESLYRGLLDGRKPGDIRDIAI